MQGGETAQGGRNRRLAGTEGGGKREVAKAGRKRGDRARKSIIKIEKGEYGREKEKAEDRKGERKRECEWRREEGERERKIEINR